MEIKHRAWVFPLEIMIPDVAVYPGDTIGFYENEFEQIIKEKNPLWCLYEDGVYLSTEDVFELVFDLYSRADNWNLVLNDYDLMRFTGFKDKHGNDIYEDDIVRERLIDYTQEDGWYWLYSVVKFVKGCWVLLERDYDYSDCKSLMDYDHLYDACSTVEVCGNIYQKPNYNENI